MLADFPEHATSEAWGVDDDVADMSEVDSSYLGVHPRVDMFKPVVSGDEYEEHKKNPLLYRDVVVRGNPYWDAKEASIARADAARQERRQRQDRMARGAIVAAEEPYE